MGVGLRGRVRYDGLTQDRGIEWLAGHTEVVSFLGTDPSCVAEQRALSRRHVSKTAYPLPATREQKDLSRRHVRVRESDGL